MQYFKTILTPHLSIRQQKLHVINLLRVILKSQKNMKRLFFMFLATLTFVACDKGGDDTPKPIELTGNTKTTQTIYADETSKADGIKFNATAPWTATVSGVDVRSGSDVEWLTLSVYEGKAGEQTLTLTLLLNTTGLDRKAEIKISCGGTTITITVEQKEVTQSGEKPEPVIISSLKIDEGTDIQNSEQLYYHSWIKMRYEWSDKRVDDVVYQARIGTDVRFDESDLIGKLITSTELNFTDPTLIDIIQEDGVGDSEYVGIKINKKKYTVSCKAFAIRFYVTEPIPYYDDGIVTCEMPAYAYDKDSFKFLYNIEEMGDDIVDGQPAQTYALWISLTWSINGKEYHSRKEHISLYKYK